MLRAMNEMASAQNRILQGTIVESMLSNFGSRFYFPKGIVAQSAEAKKEIRRRKGGYNLTAGMAYRQGEPMHLGAIKQFIPDLRPDEIFAYSTTSGELELREIWRSEMLIKNPDLKEGGISLPLVVSGITHGLCTVADLFVDPDDRILLPEMYWGNYRLIFKVRKQARIITYPLFNGSGRFNTEGLREAAGMEEGKLVILLNFPQNPTGYSLHMDEVEVKVNGKKA